MSIEDNKAIVRRFLEWWPTGDVSVLDETTTEDVVSHSGSNSYRGREAIKRRLAGHVAFFTDWKMTVHDVFAEGDRAAARYTWSGVRDGRKVELTNLAIYRIEGGRIAEEWEELDTASLAKQTGFA